MKESVLDNSNPLLEAYVTPPIDRVWPEHFLPALDTLMDKVAADFAALRDNPAPPTFANTAVPLEALLNPISDLRGILSLYVANASTDQLEEIEQTIDKKVSAFEKTLLQDPVLIRRFDAVWKNSAALRLDEDDKAILRDLHLSFEVSGAFLSASGKQRIRELDARLIELAKKFNENLKKDVARHAILVTDEVELAGINDGDRESFAEAARKQGHAAAWLISPERSLVDSLLAQAENSSFRKKAKYRSLQGTAAPSDFTEFHSMVNERRATLKENLKAHALHYQTGKPPTDQMIDALIKSQSYYTELRGMLLLVQNSQRDLAFHIAAAGAYASAEALHDAVRLKTPYADDVRPYPLTRFTHLFDSSHSYYAAGYCNYLIANVHAADGFEPFERDPYDMAWSKRLSDLYNRGSGGEPLELYRAYRGRDANPAALLRVVGEGVLKKTDVREPGEASVSP
jgi:Zn-dependent oligopeptidase